MDTSAFYEIVIKEQLDEQWAVWFLPLVLHNVNNGSTTFRGSVRDQGELHGLLEKIRDLNLTLIAVRRIAGGIAI
jgi:hypothetical protein